MPDFDEWFKRATGNYPLPYQRRFATEDEIPKLVDVPTDWERQPWRCCGGCDGETLIRMEATTREKDREDARQLRLLLENFDE
jgi:hypothetical protein